MIKRAAEGKRVTVSAGVKDEIEVVAPLSARVVS